MIPPHNDRRGIGDLENWSRGISPMFARRLRDIHRELRLLNTPAPDRGGLAVVGLVLLGLAGWLAVLAIWISKL